jgi:hypothetical protein
MSDNVFTLGLMAELLEPVTDAASQEALSERLDRQGLGLNYEGTLVYMTVNHGPMEENFHLHKIHGAGMDETEGSFLLRTKIVGITIRPATTIRFLDLWYNGTDSNHADITLEQFRKL